MQSLQVTLGNWRISLRRCAPDPAEIAALYDGSAWRWHGMVGLLGYERAYRRLMAELAADGPLGALGRQNKVLDAGIGTGALTLALADSLRDLPELHGIDLSARMLARARSRLAAFDQAGLSGRLRLGDICRLPYDNGTFDLVMSAHVAEHCRFPDEAVAELARVLKPGGTLILVTSRANVVNAAHGWRWRFRPVPSAALLSCLERVGMVRVQRRCLGCRLGLPARLSEAYLGTASQMPPAFPE